jgi:oligopeptide transport system substrate-binding protein
MKKCIGCGLFVIVFMLVGCSKRESSVVVAGRQGILLMGNGAEPEGLDPHRVSGLPAYYVITALIEGLVTEDPTATKLEPGMAERWEVSDDGKTYTFHLRDTRWSNGEPVTAQDFAFSYQRVLTPALGCPNSYMLDIIKNAHAYRMGAIHDFTKVGVKAIDSRTLQLKLAGASPYFLPMLTHYVWFPVNEKTVRAHGEPFGQDNQWAKAGNYVSNGPFVLASWVLNSVIKVEHNPSYYDAGKMKLKGIHFFPTKDDNLEEMGFRAGEYHLTNTVPFSKVPGYRETQPDLIKITDYLGVYYFMFNLTRPPLDDLRVRQALTYVIDRELLTRKMTRAGEQPAWNWVPPQIPAYPYSTRFKRDVERAKQLIAEVIAEKYPDGKLPTLELLYNDSPLNLEIVGALQQMWKTELGVEVELNKLEWKVYLKTRREKNYDICRAGWIADYADPLTFLDLFVSGSENNSTGWANAEFDNLIARAVVVSDAAERTQLLQAAETLLLKDLPVAPVYHYVSKHLLSPQVKGWVPNVLDHHNYKYLSLE